jgi:flagellar hook-length control protein FliK
MQTATNILSAISTATPGNPVFGANTSGLNGASGSDNSGLVSFSAGDPSAPTSTSFSDLLADALAPIQTVPPAAPLPALVITSPTSPATLPNPLAIAIAAAPQAPFVTGSPLDEPVMAVAPDALIPAESELNETADQILTETQTDAAPHPVLTAVVVPLPIVPLAPLVATAPQAAQSSIAGSVTATPAVPAADLPLPELNSAVAPNAQAANIVTPANPQAPATSLPAPIPANDVTTGIASALETPTPDAPKSTTPSQPVMAAQGPTPPTLMPAPVPAMAQAAPSDTAPPPFNAADNAPVPLPSALGDVLAKLNISPTVPIAVAATSKPVTDQPVSAPLANKMSGLDAFALMPNDGAQTGLGIVPAAPAGADEPALALTSAATAVANSAPVKTPSAAPETVPAAPTVTVKAPEPAPKPNPAPASEPELLPTPMAMATAAEAASSDQASPVTAMATEEPPRQTQAQATRPASTPARTADTAAVAVAQPSTASPNPSGAQNQSSLDQNTQGQGEQASGPARLLATAETAGSGPVTEASDTPMIQPMAATSQAQASSSDRQAAATAQTVPMLATEIIRKSGGRSAQFDISLTPEGLGKVDVQISINQKGELTASMVFDTPQAAAELRGRAAELQKSLEQSGFQVSQNGLSFSDTSRQGFGTAQQQAQHDQRQTPSQTRAFLEASDTAALTDLAAAKAYSPSNSRSIDVRI